MYNAKASGALKEDQDSMVIKILIQLKNYAHIIVSVFTFIIPEANYENLIACIKYSSHSC